MITREITTKDLSIESLDKIISVSVNDFVTSWAFSSISLGYPATVYSCFENFSHNFCSFMEREMITEARRSRECRDEFEMLDWLLRFGFKNENIVFKYETKELKEKTNLATENIAKILKDSWIISCNRQIEELKESCDDIVEQLKERSDYEDLYFFAKNTESNFLQECLDIYLSGNKNCFLSCVDPMNYINKDRVLSFFENEFRSILTCQLSHDPGFATYKAISKMDYFSLFVLQIMNLRTISDLAFSIKESIKTKKGSKIYCEVYEYIEKHAKNQELRKKVSHKKTDSKSKKIFGELYSIQQLNKIQNEQIA